GTGTGGSRRRLVNLSADLIGPPATRGPSEARLDCPARDLGGAFEPGQAARHTVQCRGSSAIGTTLGGFENLPVAHHVGGAAHLHLAKDMRMPSDQLGAKQPHHVVPIELA